MVLESNAASMAGKEVTEIFPFSSGVEHQKQELVHTVTGTAGEVRSGLGTAWVGSVVTPPVRPLGVWPMDEVAELWYVCAGPISKTDLVSQS